MSLKRNIAILAAGLVTVSTSLAADQLVFVAMSHDMPDRAERLVSEATCLANEELQTDFVRLGGISLEDGTQQDGVNRLSFVKVPASSSRPLIQTKVHAATSEGAKAHRESDIVVYVKDETLFDADFVGALKEEFIKLDLR